MVLRDSWLKVSVNALLALILALPTVLLVLQGLPPGWVDGVLMLPAGFFAYRTWRALRLRMVLRADGLTYRAAWGSSDYAFDAAMRLRVHRFRVRIGFFSWRFVRICLSFGDGRRRRIALNWRKAERIVQHVEQFQLVQVLPDMVARFNGGAELDFGAVRCRNDAMVLQGRAFALGGNYYWQFVGGRFGVWPLKENGRPARKALAKVKCREMDNLRMFCLLHNWGDMNLAETAREEWSVPFL